jgi:hypothetical protein
MQPKYNYRRRLPHIQKHNRPLFVTFITRHRWHLPAAAMPDHAHIIFSALRRKDGWMYSLPEVMKAIKGASAWQINVLLGRSGPCFEVE